MSGATRLSSAPLPPGTGPLGELAAAFAADFDRVQGPSNAADVENDLEVFTYAHECALLRTAWESPGRPGTFAYNCVFGRQCVAMHKEFPGHAECNGVVLTQAMTPAELDAFERGGTQPEKRRPCVLCMRANVTEHYLRMRRARFADNGRGFTSPPYIMNWYVNPFDEAGAYCGSLCLPFAEDGDVWLGIAGKMAMFSMQHLRLRQAEDRSWRVDQSPMLYDAQDFELGAERGMPPSDLPDDVLRRFLQRRTDIADAHILADPSGPSDYRAERLGQLSDAYGMALGERLFLCMLCAQNDCFSAHGAAPNWTTVCHMQYPVLRAAALSLGVAVKGRARKTRRIPESALEPLLGLFTRILDVNGSLRTVSDASLRVLKSPECRDTFLDIILCGLLGAFPRCSRHPSASARRRLLRMDRSELATAITSIPAEVPLVWCCLTELFYYVSVPSLPHIRHAFAFDKWEARAQRVPRFMDELRDGLGRSWPDDVSFASLLTSSAVSDALKRLHRRNPRSQKRAADPGVAPDAPAPPGLRVLHIKLPPLAIERVQRAIAPRDSAVATIVCCSACKKVRNFVVSPGCGAFARACGYDEMFAPSPLDNVPRPSCDGTPQCSPDTLVRFDIIASDGTGGCAIVNGMGLTLSPCCGTLCTMTSIRPSAAGAWRCEGCFS